ncbi:hypothetical protein MPNT_170030 [Candidatus Methylacidithermus pantelleriae]|uniref:Uncharacterized protein n=1 Tax=Candidatus Methylacidithermus pantelleriae TaxID=2744239 RepID=A0A8J2BNU1_9BACT|nr:hypothetical protein MPNT_170030 [Candidatus Methylacidithermus pantelleriae]
MHQNILFYRQLSKTVRGKNVDKPWLSCPKAGEPYQLSGGVLWVRMGGGKRSLGGSSGCRRKEKKRFRCPSQAFFRRLAHS